MAVLKVRASGKWHQLVETQVSQAQRCFAWISFNGQGTPSAYGSYNIKSIRDNGKGDYTMFYVNNAPSVYYSAISQSNGQVTSDNTTRVVGWIADNDAQQASIGVRFFTPQDRNKMADPQRASVLIYEREESLA